MDVASILGITFSSAAIVVLLKIIAIDIVLSGDNAIVIAMATRNLKKELQNKAIIWGTAGAVILRIVFAIIIVWLLQIPFVNIIGGVLLLWIAYTVLVGGKDESHISSHNGFMKAVGTIIMADAVMSLDNVVAVAGAADGHVMMIAIGVAISIPIMIFGSKFIVKVMDKYHWIAYAGSGILAWTAGEMLLKDKHIDEWIGISEGLMTYLTIACITVLVLLTGYFTNKRNAFKRREGQQYSQ
ncbi:TerC family protein [Lederbergia citri]|uniref:TerC family protein n=1 Tax=Lederbergia citri TaxID=2833580 RepID=A0A942TFC4_9BACI|nr:TerC family protein [Lederbergia citri]MBS4195187.1 TerC family protein [Lederbergia citri]